MAQALEDLFQNDDFIRRHIGPNPKEINEMLKTVNVDSIEKLISETVPQGIRRDALKLPAPQREVDVLAKLRQLAKSNTVAQCHLGLGYYPTITPAVIARNVLENPGWYTAYTPYQPEIAQGRLEALLNYQQMVMDLTGMEIANASLLDEATAAAEAMTLCKRSARKNKSDVFFVDKDTHRQTIAVLQTRAEPLGLEVVIGDAATDLAQTECFGTLLSYPGSSGQVRDLTSLIQTAHDQNTQVVVASDLLALVLLKSPGEMGADIVIGNSQRFGVPMGFGGPHAAFFATRESFKRSIPGRIIGLSKDTRGGPALRMAMQTREQHIRREKATSNICTAQALLAIMAVFYAIYHGPEALRTIATRVHRLTSILAEGLKSLGYELLTDNVFDTITVNAGPSILDAALAQDINLRRSEAGISISLDETTSLDDIERLLALFASPKNTNAPTIEGLSSTPESLSEGSRRTDAILEHPVFNSHHSETAMLRYMKSLENRDIALNHSMIALGSCTMKLNATAEMIPVTWPEFANIHPFAPQSQTPGYLAMIEQLEHQLIECTGYDAICMQPNSGAQGEYAGLLAIRRYHQSNGDDHRDICLIPSSAHGTNPASAAMAGMRVVIVACDDKGNVDLADLRAKAEQHSNELAAIMVTYPSTHGVFEESIRDICALIHEHGGQVYVDGANMNALVGLAAPGEFGADVSHLNLHKTFCIPHGGGGPGMGPIGVKQHLAPFVANHPMADLGTQTNDAVSAAPYGSPGILPISWVYISLMGGSGLTQATEVAILNANYMATRLAQHYRVLYTGTHGRVAHECIIDIRPLKATSGITEEDVAKRLMDFGFHAPTMSFPVAGTLMIEPTESESKAELDRFCDAMIIIRQEIGKVESGEWTLEDNPLVNAPHTQADIIDDQWQRTYSRAEAAFPAPWVKANKVWPTVNRIDNVYGDRNLFCACPPVESWAA